MKADAILMASGFSRRYEEGDKLLAPYEGVPLALRTLRLACALPELENVFFVAASPKVAALTASTRATLVHNAAPEKGSRESVRLGVAASHAEYYLFFTCDQPLLDAATVRAVLAAAAPGAIAVPAHAGRPGNPVLFSAVYRQELLNLAEGEHARDIKQRHPGAVVEVPIPSPLPLYDVDTVADLGRLTRQNG